MIVDAHIGDKGVEEVERAVPLNSRLTTIYLSGIKKTTLLTR